MVFMDEKTGYSFKQTEPDGNAHRQLAWQPVLMEHIENFLVKSKKVNRNISFICSFWEIKSWKATRSFCNHYSQRLRRHWLLSSLISISMKTIKEIYKVEGMSCTACAVSVNSMLSSVEGVTSANVNFANQTVLVGLIRIRQAWSSSKNAVTRSGTL